MFFPRNSMVTNIAKFFRWLWRLPTPSDWIGENCGEIISRPSHHYDKIRRNYGHQVVSRVTDQACGPVPNSYLLRISHFVAKEVKLSNRTKTLVRKSCCFSFKSCETEDDS